MFKYTAKNPESPLSILAASFRLYCASFFYAIVLALIWTMIFLSADFLFMHLLDMDNIFYSILPGIFSSFISLIFFIPLIKRIYSVGAQLPISTLDAFSGFFQHFGRLVLLMLIAYVAAMILPGIWTLINPQVSNGFQITVFCLLIVLYVYVILKFYFTPLFIVLENKSVLTALKSSLQIEHSHMWLTFCVLAIYYFGYQCIVSFTSGYFVWMPFGLDLYLILLSTLAVPLFLSIQICQFFNLKRLSK